MLQFVSVEFGMFCFCYHREGPGIHQSGLGFRICNEGKTITYTFASNTYLKSSNITQHQLQG